MYIKVSFQNDDLVLKETFYIIWKQINFNVKKQWWKCFCHFETVECIIAYILYLLLLLAL